MVVNKPSIFIYTYEPDREDLKEILAGIEVEGVLYEVYEKEQESVEKLAFEAATDSMLGSGIGISRKEMAMQMRLLPLGKNVFRLYNPSREALRMLGANSARAVKKMPFKE